MFDESKMLDDDEPKVIGAAFSARLARVCTNTVYDPALSPITEIV